MKNCLYNKNNNMKNTGSCCGNMKNSSNVNMNCKSIKQNQSCGNLNNNFNRKNSNSKNSQENRTCDDNELMEDMKLELQATDFAIEDLALYLDTHPDDIRAVSMHNQCAKNYRKLSDEYQKVYGPLNIMYPCNSWRWLEEPWPWQKTNDCLMMQNYRTTNKEIENDFDLKGGIN